MLRKIPDRYFEAAGTVCGLVACAVIAMQVRAEYSTAVPSTMSTTYVVGFLAIFAFWTLYGVRFRRAALWITNGIAVATQTLLLIVISLK